MCLKLAVSLEKLSIIATAIYFWELPEIKKKMLNLCNLKIPQTCLPTSLNRKKVYLSFWDKEVIPNVMQNVMSENFPEKIKTEIQYIIPLIGDNILSWALYLLLKLKLEAWHLNKIYWTCTGTIDQVKFLKMYLEKHPEAETREIKIRHTNLVIYTPFEILSGSYLLETLLGSRNDLLLWCSSIDLKNAVTYLVRNNSDKNRIMHLIIEKLIYLRHAHSYPIRGRLDPFDDNINRIQRLTQLLIFLLNEEKEKYDFISEYYFEIVCMFLQIWQYQELALHIVLIVIDLKIIVDYDRLFRLILCRLTTNDDEELIAIRYKFRKRMHYKIAEALMERMQAEEKIKLWNASLLKNYLKTCEPSAIGVILKDSCLGHVRKELIDQPVQFFDELVQKGDFECLTSFQKVIALSNDEKKKFKSNYNFLKIFAEDGKFELAEKLVHWLTDLKEKRMELKRRIDTVEICEVYLRNNRFDLSLVEKLLVWQFDRDRDMIRQLKNVIRSAESFRMNFSDFWEEHCNLTLEQTINGCSEFLEWFFNPEEMDVLREKNSIKINGKVYKHIHFPEGLMEHLNRFKL